MYYDVLTELDSDERPSLKVVNDDEAFNKWIEAFNRSRAQKTATMRKVAKPVSPVDDHGETS
jgi:hypothetical protein